MSLVTPGGPAPGTITAEKAPRVRRTKGRTLLLAAVGGFVLLALVRVVSGANDITTGGAFAATISLAVPIALAGLGGLWSERSGVVNIGLEGMMILGTWFGAAFAYFSHSPWMGVLGGVVGGLLGGLVHAVATVTFGVDQIISGVAITILSTGAARFLAGVFFTGQPGGGPTQSPSLPTFGPLQVPGAASSLLKIERHHWFLLSDLAGLLRAITTTLTPFTILMIALFPATWFVLWRTSFGLRLRACGENPDEAETLGVGVYRMKYAAVLISGVMAGLAGAFLADFGGLYREGQTGGRGYIGLAAMIFGNWRPGGLAAGAGLFGYTDAVQSRQGGDSVHALLLFVVFLLAALAVVFAARRSVRPAALSGVAAALFLVWYLGTDSVPIEFVPATPYVITLLVLALASQRLRMPAADGLPLAARPGFMIQADVPLDLADPAVVDDPYPAFAASRARAAVQWHDGLGMWLAFDHAACNAVLRTRSLGRIWVPRPSADPMPAFALIHENSLLENEPPVHTRLRRLVAAAFARGHVERLRPRIAALAEALADRVAELGGGGAVVDLIAHYAEPLPVQVIAELLGVPEADWSLLRPWSNSIVKMYEYGVAPERQRDAETAAREFVDYLRMLVARRRLRPGDDLISSLIAETDADGARLSEDELVTTCTLLLNAGHEATVNVVGNGVAALLARPAELARVRADPDLVPTAVEELIRFDSPLQLFERTAVADTVIGEVTVRAGDRIAALLGAANRDPAVFSEPDRLDVARTPNPHLGFGAGIHFCVGAPLARVELQASLATLLRRFPRLAGAATPVRRPEFVLRG